MDIKTPHSVDIKYNTNTIQIDSLRLGLLGVDISPIAICPP
ncbi:hypothetical protein VKI21_02275 [Cyanobacterium aponinum UTEX 3222]|nr:hypothetical protein VKI21_02275 [Cyanobacterium aponinum UTEX 3222]